MASLVKTLFVGLFGSFLFYSHSSNAVSNFACPAPSISAIGGTVDCRDGLVRLRINDFDNVLYTYQWFRDGTPVAGQTFEDILLTLPEESGDYTVRATDSSDPGCVSSPSNSIAVLINELPERSAIPTVIGSNPGCAGDDIVLSSTVSAPAGGLYRWFRNGVSILGETNASLTINESNSSGDYTVEVISAASCASGQSVPVSVTIEPLPEPPSIGLGPTGSQICADGTQITLTSEPAPDGGTYTWFKNGNILTVNTQNILLSTAEDSGNYAVQVTDGDGAQCTSLTGIVQSVQIFELPTVASTSDDLELCAESSVILGGNTALVGQGTWTTSSGGVSFSNVHDPNATVSGLTPGVYEFNWQIDNGLCVGIPASQQVEIFAAPSPAITEADRLLCDLNSTVISAQGITSGQGRWEIVSGDGQIEDPDNNNTLISNMTLDSEVILSWTVSNGVCTEERDELRIELSSSPSAAQIVDGDQQLCAASQTSLEAMRPSIGVGTWSIINGTATIDDPTQNVIELSGLVPGEDVIARWTVANRCGVNQVDILVENEAAPDIAGAGEDQELCGIDRAALTGSGNGGTWTVVSGAGTFDNSSSPITSVTGLAIGENVLRYSINAAICDDSEDDVIITVFEEPSAAELITSNTIFCAGETTVQISAEPPLVGNGTWEVISGEGSISASTSPSTDISGLAPGETVLRWTVTNGSCNANSTDLIIFIYESPAVESANVEICTGQSIQLNAIGGDRYVWSPSTEVNNINISNPIVTPTETTSYTVSIEREGCPDDQIDVNVKVNPNPELQVSADTTIFANQRVQLFATGANEYAWSPVESLDNPNSPSPVASPLQTTTYAVTGTNEFNCSAEAAINVFVDTNFEIFVPELFSPNGDNVNDVLLANAVGAVIKEFRVYDRRGRELFVTDNENNGWNGSFNGSDQSMDSYIYFVVAELPTGEKITRKGSVQLVR